MKHFTYGTSRAASAFLPWLIVAGICLSSASAEVDRASGAGSLTQEIFRDEPISFLQEGPDTSVAGAVTTLDNGRVIVRTTQIACPTSGATRVLARVVTRPVPKDEVSVHDPWDRAGNARLSLPGKPDIELVKFVTAYGGVTEHEVDVTHLAPLLQGTCTFKGFVDTWVSPAWTMDLSLTFEWDVSETRTMTRPTWVEPLFYEESATAESLGEDGFAIDVDVPERIGRVVLHYLASGHCTDGTDEDEFVSKDNVISVDGVAVERYKPWRADCRDFRAVNPYTRRWSDGVWSSDYDRSGWCPGDSVPPLSLDLTDHLTPGRHVVGFNVERVRPEGEDGHLGYWRMSGYLVGWGRD
jgi:hypothetical protein